MRATSICLGLAAATAVAACGSSGSSASKQPAVARTPAAKPSRAASTTHHAAAKPAPAKTPTESTAAKPVAPKIVTPHPVPIPAARAKVEAPRKWSGTGNTVLGTLALPRNVVVHWTVSGGSFGVADGSGKLSIAGKGTTGQSFAASGTYPAVKVTANGTWTLTIASLGA